MTISTKSRPRESRARRDDTAATVAHDERAVGKKETTPTAGAAVSTMRRMSTEQQESHRLLTVPEVAKQLRLSKGTVYKLIRDLKLPAVQLGETGASLRVKSDELERWLHA